MCPAIRHRAIIAAGGRFLLLSVEIARGGDREVYEDFRRVDGGNGAVGPDDDDPRWADG